ncbi:UDP-2,3-diacylglucosamine diphosphatase [Francisella adeliensis]|uniref:UDP-2,3-diacylglucosamine hydrolase n=1 Tax=Francisella adeliensis TaxID=2007306 RepID=A0A2Z4XZI0_9GAMM|nr:UDP-2,3-diacylglucosamine diphosphatase [Francisella adeliensis]AXA34058.1 UDP-2,3-diacylglucosamine diphosphatase [Francisella adeliensis]MBK2085221.1 UDP-2,3-diacylglucosamine diphosphatase [Francisella adeliensis]MBK2096011.1 UDP-2,3-diacylglucosamine diphosphatase [Francisella adeliensis]QIW12297.1 UDP-2,3-diacylglucosamine diphosphatase [Francisella adeliensis]QIW14171.1 UDP-2,3-diacylglucosamine diphosphatase [Francisella adeliensis]
MDHNKDIYIVADLHLNEGHAEMADVFKQFLKSITSSENILFIMGDFFDYWIGDNHKDEFYHEITSWLKKARDDGLEILFIHGNRDFLIGKKFAKQSGVKILKDPYYATIAGKKILFSHGDLFCTDDKSYQIYRKWIAYNYPLRFIFRRLPLFLREKTAQNVRNHSYAKNRKDPTVDVTAEGIAKYRKDCDVVIHGHTHRMNIHHEKDHTRYVVGDWYKTGNYLKISKNGEINLIREIKL